CCSDKPGNRGPVSLRKLGHQTVLRRHAQTQEVRNATWMTGIRSSPERPDVARLMEQGTWRVKSSLITHGRLQPPYIKVDTPSHNPVIALHAHSEYRHDPVHLAVRPAVEHRHPLPHLHVRGTGTELHL